MSASFPEARLRERKIFLPPAPKATARYKPCVIVGDLVYVSGHTPDDAGCKTVGKVQKGVSVAQAKAAARETGLAILASLKATLGSLDRIKRCVFAEGKVNCSDLFTEHPEVINGFSELMAEVFGEAAGIGTRNATGCNSLPGGVPVEITQCIFELEDAPRLM